MSIIFTNNFLPFCLLLILFELKHFVADFLLQTKYMLGKFKPGWDFILPLSTHCAVNAIFTYIILVGIGKTNLWPLVIFDFISHFLIDRMKSSPKWLGKYRPEQSKFWWVLGLDQALHHIVYITIVLAIMSRMG